MICSSIAALMGVVALCGLGFAALRNPTEAMASTIYSGLIVALMTGGFLAATSGGRRRRRFWAMFTASGTVHLALILVSDISGLQSQPITVHLVEWAYARLAAPRFQLNPLPLQEAPPTSIINEGTEWFHARRVDFPFVDEYQVLIPLSLYRIGVHLATLAVALIGGGLAALVPIGPRSNEARSREET